AVNADGSVIVGTSSTGRDSEAFVWDNVHGMRRLADVLADDGVNTSGWLLRTAYAVSGDGTVIAGEGSYNGSFSTGFVAMLDRPLIGPPPEVSGRHVFYNHSAYDGGDASADPRDLAAVAP